jgi:diguanylate cyclase (GGDEF)-like protein
MYEEKKWKEILASLDFAFQPIVNVNTGVCIGVEALLRGYEKAGFSSILSVFDTALKDSFLYTLDLKLREKAVKKYLTIPFYNNCRLFYNLDMRILKQNNYSKGNTKKILETHGLSINSLVFDISESKNIYIESDIASLFNNYRDQGYNIAIDDFGSGLSSLEVLYKFEPEYVKIDKFFLHGIANDHKKKTFVAKALNLAQLFGNIVIAEGIESTEDFLMSKDIGFDYAQGFVIQKPQLDTGKLQYQYDHILKLIERSRRSDNTDHRFIHEQLEYVTPIIDELTTMPEIFDMFKSNENITYFPVINNASEPLGIIREKDLKKYVYSKFGKEILLNQTVGKTVKNFIYKCPITEIFKSVEKILAIYSMDEHTEGIILTANGKYLGMLNANSLLKALHEKNLSEARDANPLTKLPGNNSINEYMAETYYDIERNYVYIYFDFDNFKPFNDKYGFRLGDRAILLFANLLRDFARNGSFAAHIGGDDFFAGINLEKEAFKQTKGEIKKLMDKFSEDILPFLNEEDRKNGYIISTSREGERKTFPLLSVSAAVLNLTKNRKKTNLEDISQVIARLKKKAKSSKEKISTEKI